MRTNANVYQLFITLMLIATGYQSPVDAHENNEAFTFGTQISGPNVNDLKYGKYDQSCIVYYRNTFRDSAEQKNEYEMSVLKYIGYQFRFGNIITDDEKVMIEFLLELEYSDVVRADLLKAYYHLWESGKHLYGFGLLADITNKYSAEDFEECFGEFMILYYRMYVAKQSGHGVEEWKDKIVARFIEKYEGIVESSVFFEIRDGVLTSNIPLGLAEQRR